MDQKTQIVAPEGKQELTITRTFNLPLTLLFKAYEEPKLLAQWMGTNVIKLENKKHGGYNFETTDPQGNIHRFNGVIHDIFPNEKIIRTFEMENTTLDPWIEYLTFEELTETTSKLTMHVVYKSVAIRDQIVQLPFAKGINWAHNRLQEVVEKLKL